jgi:hypothetical protein
MTNEAAGAALASSPMEQTVQTTAPVPHSGILLDNSAADSSANTPRDPNDSVMSLSRDLRALHGQALELWTWPALPSAQHVGDKITSVLESATITSPLVQEDVSTANLVLSHSVQSSQAQNSIDETTQS